MRLVVLSMILVLVSGCALLDSLSGVGQGADNRGVVGPITDAGSSLPGWVGLGAGLIGSLFGAYKTYREKKLGIANGNYHQAVEALVSGIDRAFDSGVKLSVSKEELYAALMKLKDEKMNDPEFLTKLVAEIKSLARLEK